MFSDHGDRLFHILGHINKPVDTGRKLNVHKTFRRRPGRLLNVLCTFNLRPVSTGKGQKWQIIEQLLLLPNISKRSARDNLF